jgi:hypothetical protein
MKQRINKMPVINWFKKKCIPDYADILLTDFANKEEGNKEFKTQINDIMNLDDVPIPIRMITEPFANAMADTMPQFTKEKIWTSLEDNVVYSGVLILSDVVYYRFTKRPEAIDYDIIIAAFDKKTTLLYFYRQVSGYKNRTYINPLHIYRMKQLAPHLEEAFEKDVVNNINMYYYQVTILFELFRKYAEVEIKVIKPKMKAELFKCKYHNDNDHSIEIMDSTWFTTLIKSDEFKVRGHFRLQPCGQAFAERKLVWIKDFTKEGYTRKAKKELEIA